MVCLGNICRSPLGEGILKSKVPEEKFIIDSAGTASYHIGSPPDIRSIKVAKDNNIDISKNIFFTTPIYNLLRILTSFSVKNRYLPLTVFFFVKPAKEVLSNLVTMYPRCSKILLTILFFPI